MGEVECGPDLAERLMNEYGDGLLRMCFLYLGDRTLAEDAAQDAIVRAWQGYDTFRGASSEKTWLTAIAINVCRGLLRSPWQKRRVFSPEWESLSGGEVSEADDTVLQAVLALPPKYREVVVLYYYEEQTTQEIAQTLGIPRSTVSVRLKRARERLKPVLKEWYNG